MGQEPVQKSFSWYGHIPVGNDVTIVTVPAGWHAIIMSIWWKFTNATIDVKFGATIAFTQELGTEVRLAGNLLAAGAAGNDLHVVEGGAGNDCYLAISGVIVQEGVIARITS